MAQIGSRPAVQPVQSEAGRCLKAAVGAQISLPRLLSGEATFLAMKSAVDDLVNRVPQDHDVFIITDNVLVFEARFIEPRTFLFEGLDPDGNRTGIVCHFTQVRARVLSRPKRNETRFVSQISLGVNPDAPSA